MNHILVPVDGSEGASRAARFAGQLARDTGAELTLLYVYDAPAATMLGFRAESDADVDKRRTAVSRKSFDMAREAIGSGPIEIATHVEIGHPAQQIVTHAEAIDADVVVMGSRGLSPIQSMMLGSVSEYVVRHASCPVTIVR